MFESYTTKQLVRLRSLCVEMTNKTEEARERAEFVLLLKNLDKELADRQRRQSP